MNRRRVAVAAAGLLLGLIFYLGYRSDRTLGNRVVHAVLGAENYRAGRVAARACLPVPESWRGSLPSALWCLIAASLIGGWRVAVGRARALPLAVFCPCFNAAWEIVQWLGWTDGRADPLDVVAGIAGWALARLLFRAPDPAGIPLGWNWRLGVVAVAIACMGMADVWR